MSKQKKYLFQDLTGRGINSRLTADHISNNWELTDTDGDGITLSEFLDTAEIGDIWETNSIKLTRI